MPVLLSRKQLQHILGALWLLDGLLQLQPQMFTMNMITSIMLPNVNAQPALIAENLKWIIQLTTQYLIAASWTIAGIQVMLGLCLLSGRYVKQAIIVSVLWALMVWYAGNGMGMLLTGQATALTGSPGAVLLYALLGLVVYPRDASKNAGLLSREDLRRALAGLWLLAALLQVQPYWWQRGQISHTIAGLYSPGTLSGLLVDPSLHWLAGITNGIEVPLNLTLILLFLSLAVGIAFARPPYLRQVLVLSIIASLLIWWGTEALGMVLTGMATDVNSAPLLILIALACWPSSRTHKQHILPRSQSSRARLAREERYLQKV